MLEKWTGISLVTEGIALILHLCALSSSNWISLNAESEDFGFNLLSCSACPSDYIDYTPECLLSIDCLVSPSSPLCPFAKRLSQARDYYLTAGLLALAITVVIGLNQTYKAMQCGSASKRVIYWLGIVRVLASNAALLLWIGQMKREIGKRGRAGEGVWYGAGAIFAASVSTLAILKTFSSAKSSIFRTEKALTGLKLRLYCLLLPLISLSLTFNTLAYLRPWIHYTSPVPHQGTLFTIDSYLHFSDIDYSCIAGPACRSPLSAFDIRHCSSFQRLSQAGKLFVWYDTAGFVAELLWLISAVYMGFRVRYGPWVSIYAWPVLAAGLKTTAVWYWLRVTGASLTGDCATQDWYRYIKVCADTGALYALCHLACLLLSVLLFLAISLYHPPPAPVLPKSLSLRAVSAISQGTNGLKCAVCDGVKQQDETFLKLPCSHWLHIHCFRLLSYATYRKCPKCTHR
jgi:hypothetical protein